MEYSTLLRSPGARLGLNPAWMLSLLGSSGREVTFVQIGANDGLHDDPLRQHVLAGGWRGVLIEPHPDFFERLQRNYDGVPNLTFLNAAVGTGQMMTFSYIDADAPGLPGWTRGIGSVVETNVLKHGEECPAILSHVRRQQIPTLTINDALAQLHTTHIDLVLTDVEGYDAQLLHQIDFTRWRPGCLYYESRHLDRKVHDGLLHHLVGSGYLVSPGPIDSVAVLPGFPALSSGV